MELKVDTDASAMWRKSKLGTVLMNTVEMGGFVGVGQVERRTSEQLTCELSWDDTNVCRQWHIMLVSTSMAFMWKGTHPIDIAT